MLITQKTYSMCMFIVNLKNMLENSNVELRVLIYKIRGKTQLFYM